MNFFCTNPQKYALQNENHDFICIQLLSLSSKCRPKLFNLIFGMGFAKEKSVQFCIVSGKYSFLLVTASRLSLFIKMGANGWRKSHLWYYCVLSTLRHICKKQNKLNNLIFLFCEANMCANKCCISVYKVTSHLLGKRETRFTCETVWQSDSDSGHIWWDKCFLSFYKVTSHQFWLRTHLMNFLNGRYWRYQAASQVTGENIGSGQKKISDNLFPTREHTW